MRLSYGVSGNDQIDNFRYRAQLGGEAVYPFDNQLVTGRAIGGLGNQDLKWETTHQANLGFDLKTSMFTVNAIKNHSHFAKSLFGWTEERCVKEVKQLTDYISKRTFRL